MREKVAMTEEEERNTLAAYALTVDQSVEVEVLVAAGQSAPRRVEGRVAGATGNVLLIAQAPAQILYRIPWPAIALIRNTVTTTAHPATQ